MRKTNFFLLLLSIIFTNVYAKCNTMNITINNTTDNVCTLAYQESSLNTVTPPPTKLNPGQSAQCSFKNLWKEDIFLYIEYKCGNTYKYYKPQQSDFSRYFFWCKSQEWNL